MAINLNDFAQAAESGGKIRLQADAPDKVKSSSQSLWRRLRGANSEEKAENRAVRAAFLDALEAKYGKAFADSVAGQVNEKSSHSLSAKEVRALIQAGKENQEANQAVNRGIIDKYSPDSSSFDQGNFASIFAQKANELGFNHPMSELGLQKLQDNIRQRISSEGNMGRRKLTDETAQRLAGEEIQKFINKKMALEQKVQDMGVSDTDRQILLDHAMKHDNPNPKLLEQAWELGKEATKMAAVLGDPDASRADRVQAVAAYIEAYDNAVKIVAEGENPEDFGADDLLELNSAAIELCMKAGVDPQAAQMIYNNMTGPEMKELREAALVVVISSAEGDISMETADRMRRINDMIALVVGNAGAKAGVPQDEIHEAQKVSQNIPDVDGISPDLIAELQQVGINDIQYSDARKQELHRASLPGLHDESSVLGQSPAELVKILDDQNAQLRRIQQKDLARLEMLGEEPGKAALENQIAQRSELIEKNNQRIDRLYQGEHPTIIQWEMVQQRSLLLKGGERQQLDEAYKELNPRAQNVDQQAALDAILNQPFAPLSQPPPKVLPPLPGEKPAALQRNNSVRDMLKNQGAVANNPFKVQDNAVKAGQQADPEALQQDGDAIHQSTGKALGSSPKPQAPAPKPGAKKLGGL